MKSCIFCNEIFKDDIIFDTEHFFIVFDIDPIQEGHLLIISKQHMLNMTELPDEQLLELGRLEQQLIHTLETNFDLLGVTQAMNNGNSMDLNVHFHVHLIPRYHNDNFWTNLEVTHKPFDIEKLKDMVAGQKANLYNKGSKSCPGMDD